MRLFIDLASNRASTFDLGRNDRRPASGERVKDEVARLAGLSTSRSM